VVLSFVRWDGSVASSFIRWAGEVAGRLSFSCLLGWRGVATLSHPSSLFIYQAGGVVCNGWGQEVDAALFIVLGSPVQSGLLSKFDKTGTGTDQSSQVEEL
jgi:hypothetical protein